MAAVKKRFVAVNSSFENAKKVTAPLPIGNEAVTI